MRRIIKSRKRNVDRIRRLKVLPTAKYAFGQNCYIPQDKISREIYFLSALQELAECKLIFFDPDTGLQTDSKPCGRKGSEKYLYYSEVKRAFDEGHSLLIYQHFPRIPRKDYVKFRVKELGLVTKASVIFCFSTKFVCFFLISQKRDAKFFKKQAKNFVRNWEDCLDLENSLLVRAKRPGLKLSIHLL